MTLSMRKGKGKMEKRGMKNWEETRRCETHYVIEIGDY